jgi:hypothetical protein
MIEDLCLMTRLDLQVPLISSRVLIRCYNKKGVTYYSN